MCYSPCYELLVLDLWSSFIIISSAVVSLVRRSKQCYYKVPKHRLTLDLRPASLTNTPVHQIPPLRSRAGTTTAVPRSSTNPVSLNTIHHQVTEPASRCVSSTSTNTCSRQSLPCLTTNKLPSQHPSCVSLSPHQENPCRCDGASPCRFTTSLRNWVGPAMVTHRTSHFFIPARLAVHRNCLKGRFSINEPK